MFKDYIDDFAFGNHGTELAHNSLLFRQCSDQPNPSVSSFSGLPQTSLELLLEFRAENLRIRGEERGDSFSRSFPD